MPNGKETYDQYREVNAAWFEMLTTPGMEKKAQDAVTDFTRMKMREGGFFRRVLPMVSVTDDDLDIQVNTDEPAIVCEKEPDNPGAVSVPFGQLPSDYYIYGPRYLVTFSRILTPRFTKDVDELRTYRMDIRQILTDNAIKDMLAEEDGKFIAAVNTALGTADAANPVTGAVQWETIAGGIDRDSLLDAFKILPKAPGRFEVATVLCNNVTIKEIEKFYRDEMGGDASEQLLREGWSFEEFHGARWIITNKRDLVPDNTLYMFAEPKAMGKSFSLEDSTMWIKSEAYLVEFFLYETIGSSIANIASLARADFT